MTVVSWTEQQVVVLRTHLRKLLASPQFSRSERQRRFLEFIVSGTLEGTPDRLKEYTIGLEVFDRPPSFDPATEAIVRVEAGRLRNKLREYYEDEGSGDPVRFRLPKGAYSVEITFGPASPSINGRPPVREAGAAPGIPGEKPSVAVLPFSNLGGDPEQGYFADGITEDLITDLSNLSGLLVIARQSAFVYKQSAKRAEEIGRELGVRYLVEGSVRRSANRVRVTAQLIDVASGTQLWAERYDRDLKEIFDLQDDISRRIVSSLNVRLIGIEPVRLAREGTTSVESHDQLLRGLEHYWMYSRESTEQARRFFLRAVEIDPGYATPHAWLARACTFQWCMMWERGDSLERAYQHARRALELAPHLPYGHSVLGWVQLWRKQRDAAIEAGLKGIALDPNNADAHMFVSLTLSASGLGQEAMGFLETARRVDPHPSPFFQFALCQCCCVMGRIEDAIAAAKHGVALSEVFLPNRIYLAWMYGITGKDAEADGQREAILRIRRNRTPVIDSIWLDPEWDRRFNAFLAESGLL